MIKKRKITYFKAFIRLSLERFKYGTLPKISSNFYFTIIPHVGSLPTKI